MGPENALGSLDRGIGELNDPCAGVKRRAGFVEREMSVGADPQNEEIDAARLPDGLFVVLINKVDVRAPDVDEIEEVAKQVRFETVGIITPDSQVFIQMKE